MSSEVPKPALTDLQARIKAVTRLMPIADLPRRERGRHGHCVVRGGGRPKKIEVAPTADADDYNAALDEQRQVWVHGDAVVGTQTDPTVEPVARLRAIERALAEETAALLWDRREAERQGRDGSQIATRRIDALQKLGLTVLGRVRFYEPDIAPEKLRTIAALWVEMMKEAAEVLPADHAGPFVAKVETAMDAWLRGAGR